MSTNTVAPANLFPQQPSGATHELAPHQSVVITPELVPSGKPELAAVVQASNSELATYHAQRERPVDKLMVVDMRSVPPSNVHGYRLFGEEYITASADYLLIDPVNLDFENNQGFKALRAGETFNYGRPTDQTPSTDRKSRFKNASSVTSRDHFDIAIGLDGSVTITDKNSSNGTVVLTGDVAHEAMNNNNREIKVLSTAPEIGKLVLQNEVDNFAAETGTTRAIILGQSELSALKDVAYDPSQPILTRELLLQYPELEAKGGIRMGNYDFMFSGIVSDAAQRKHAVAYVKDDAGKVSPRLFYKSVSDGGWRATPGVYDDTGAYSKGEDDKDGGYVQLTKPMEEIVQYLEATEKQGTIPIDGKDLRSLFKLQNLDRQGLNSFDQEVKVTRLQGRKLKALYDAYQPGVGFMKDGSKARQELAEVVLPKGFEPTFDTVERRYDTAHSLAGKTKVKVYAAEFEGRAIEWHMAESELGDVWIDKIAFKNAEVNSYGTANEVILAGALSTKPYEYSSQVERMAKGADFEYINSSTYVCMSPFWNNLKPIQRYRQNRRS